MSKTVRVAAIQAEPVWNDLQGGVDKSIKLIQEASFNGANVVGFPEVFIPGYPWSIWAKSPTENGEFMNEYFNNSMELESPEMERIKNAVKDAGIFCVMAYSERFQGTLYISQTFINEEGQVVLHRRKIKPTHVERAYWGDGQGESLQTVVKSSFGNIGGLKCWEHTQTLLRYYEYTQNSDIHVASWPCIFLVEGLEKWPYHISTKCSQEFTRILAIEGGCFALIATQVVSKEHAAKIGIDGFRFARLPSGGFSMIFGPFGEELVEPLPADQEGILYADCDLSRKAEAKQNLDLVGHYSRPDMLSLRVNRYPSKPVFFAQDL
ncbi:hypothetical protein UA08_08685 [Talaromyces atroroseus]|uniref:nitrilase n=1 Tax=Talaromyces atroroseus TaxID=1441469 RepID=A0A225AGH1_TALAT|nr:hypothetical protein UA08_08685 [Talaromyces atroroseus]OKL56108.1 hypothetical protein UA08_08685 [Talaromyces atroroseus]